MTGIEILVLIYAVSAVVGLINVLRVVRNIRKTGEIQMYEGGFFSYRKATNGDVIHEVLWGFGWSLIPVINLFYALFILVVTTGFLKLVKRFKTWLSKEVTP